MSKNTQISELINYISVDGSGNVVLSSGQLVATQSYVSTAITNLVNSAPSTLDTLNELATALGNDPNFATTVATSIGTKQAQLNGTGFVKISGTTISYDNSTYLTTSSASSTYLPLSGGTLTGALAGTTSAWNGFAINATPSSVGTAQTFVRYISAGSDWYIGSESSVAGTFFGGSSAYASVFFGTNPFQFITAGVKRFEIATGGVTSTVGYTGTSATFSGAVVVASPFTIKDTNPYIQWKNASDTRLGYIQHATNLVMSADTGDIALTTTSGQFWVKSNGTVSIGNTNPQNLFNANVKGIVFGNYSSISSNSSSGWTSLANNAAQTIGSSESTGWSYQNTDAAARFALTNGGFRFQVTGTGTAGTAIGWVDAMTIMDSFNGGKVGIGTASPTALLHVKGTNARIRLTGDTYTSIEIEDGGTGDPGYIRTYNYGSAVCQIGIGGTYFNVGDIGIGTSTPLQTTANRTVLTVNGTNTALINLAVGGVLGAYWYYGGTSSQLYSVGQLDFNTSNATGFNFNPNGQEAMRITSGGTMFHKGYVGSTLMGGYSMIGTISAVNIGDRYLHVKLNTIGTMMFWIKVFGYSYTAGILEGMCGGYIGGGTGPTNQSFQNGSIPAQYQNNGYLEVVVDTLSTATTNRWGSITFLGGTDTLTTVQPLEIMTFSWSASTTRVY